MRKILIVLSLGAVVLIQACNTIFKQTEIVDITSAPNSYDGKTVTVAGFISNIISIPLVNIRAFKLKDGEDSIWILGRAPKSEGSEVLITGEVDVAIRLGDMNLGTVIRLKDEDSN